MKITSRSSLAVVLALLAAAEARAGEEEPSPLRVVVEPAALVLERGARPADVFVEVPNDASVSDVRLYASNGTVTALRAGDERPATLRSAYAPPDSYHPQLAILVATALVDGERHIAWAVLPLLGRGTVTVRAAPHAPVSLDVGGRAFGPIRADAAGEARVPIEVPPGVDAAYFGERVIPIDAVPFSRVMLLAEETRFPAGVASEARVHVFAATERGEPLDDVADVRVEADAGSLSALTRVAPGHAVLRYALPALPPGVVALRARLGDDDGPASESLLEVEAGPPALVKLSFDRARFVAGEGPVSLRVRVLDENGAPADAIVSLDAEGAVLGARATPERGLLQVAVRPPDTLPDVRLARIRARAVARGGGAPALVASIELPLVPAPPARIVIAPAADSIVADGEGSHVLVAEVLDAFGNRVPRAPLVASAELGRARVVDDSSPYAIAYTPPVSYDDAVDTIEARAGEVVGVLRPPLSARPKRFFVGALAGGLSNFAGLHAPALSLDASYRLDDVSPWLRGFELSASASAFHRFIPGSLTSAGAVDAHLSGAPFAIGARYHVEVLPAVSVYAGGQAGLAVFNSLLVGRGRFVERFFAAYGSATAGLAWSLGPGVVVVEAGAGAYATEAPATVSGFLGGFLLLGGYRVALL